jgi:hypothetical protein
LGPDQEFERVDHQLFSHAELNFQGMRNHLHIEGSGGNDQVVESTSHGTRFVWTYNIVVDGETHEVVAGGFFPFIGFDIPDWDAFANPLELTGTGPWVLEGIFVYPDLPLPYGTVFRIEVPVVRPTYYSFWTRTFGIRFTPSTADRPIVLALGPAGGLFPPPTGPSGFDDGFDGGFGGP